MQKIFRRKSFLNYEKRRIMNSNECKLHFLFNKNLKKYVIIQVQKNGWNSVAGAAGHHKWERTDAASASLYSYPRDSNPAVKPILSLKKISFMQVIIADASMFFTKLCLSMKTWKNRAQKLFIIGPFFFITAPSCQNGRKLKIHIRNLS